MIPLITLAVAIFVATFIFISWPLLNFKSAFKKQNSTLKRLDLALYEKERLLTNLKDLELDRSMGKITAEDYDNLREQLLSEASHIYQTLDEIEKAPLLQKIENDAMKVGKEMG
jgi:hypothetical protein